MTALTNFFGNCKDVEIGTNATRLNHVLTVISSSRRRQVIDIVHERRSIELTDLVDSVAASESGGETVSPTERNRVYTSLYQTHVPELAKYAVIEYDPDQQQINATKKLDSIYSATSDFAEALHNAPMKFR